LESKVSCESIGSRFYSTLGYTKRSTGRWENQEDKARYQGR
jgi:hypothetical protein